MKTDRFSLRVFCLLLSLLGSSVFASPEDEQVADYLRSHNMLSLLKVQLETRIERENSADGRDDLVTQLSELYLEELEATDPNDPYRQVILLQAYALISKMGTSSMYELRIELIVSEYQRYEAAVELHRIELLEPDRHQSTLQGLKDLRRRLKTLTNKLDPEVARAEKLTRKNSSDDSRIQQQRDELANLRRYKSLSHYYAAWTGYSIAVLSDTHVSSDVFESFGWLLGGRGNQPKIEDHHASTFEFDHVARSAIGVALAYSQSSDSRNAIDWLTYLIESDSPSPEIIDQANDRMIQVFIENNLFEQAYAQVLYVYSDREKNTMRTAQARFIALKSLRALERSSQSQKTKFAELLAKQSIGQLLEQGEVGHVLDLYSRYDSFPFLGKSFVPLYAIALKELNRVEHRDLTIGYSSPAKFFAQALEADDANQYPSHRNDCRLKLAYCYVQGSSPAKAVKVCEQVIKESGDDKVIEEARWIRIAALESARVSQDQINQAVREYMLAYPSTPRSAKLILRYALKGTVDSLTAIKTLESIDDTDPIALAAKQTLVKLEYEHLRATGFIDQDQIRKTLGRISWIQNRQEGMIENLNDANARMNIARIGLDLSLRLDPVDINQAQSMLEWCYSILAYDESFEPYRSEFLYRQITIALQSNNPNRANEYLDQLRVLDESRAKSGQLLIYHHAVKQWETSKTQAVARRVINLGVGVLADQSPKHPEPIGLRLSGVAERVSESSWYLWTSANEDDKLALASRLSKLVIMRGKPTEPGLRLATQVFNASNDQEDELGAWKLLLSAYPSSDPLWYQARYETLRIMKDIDFQAALQAYDQFTIMHPSMGPAPWNQRIAQLFGDTPPNGADSPSKVKQP